MEPGRYERAAAPPESIARGAQELAAAADPLIWAGGGVLSSGASEALREVAEHLQAPVITTAEGKGAISDRHYLSLGTARYRNDPLAERMPQHDVVLGGRHEARLSRALGRPARGADRDRRGGDWSQLRKHPRARRGRAPVSGGAVQDTVVHGARPLKPQRRDGGRQSAAVRSRRPG